MDKHTPIGKNYCSHPIATRPIFYTDSLGGEQVGRDDMWAVTTDELNRLQRENERLREALKRARAYMFPGDKTVYSVDIKAVNDALAETSGEETK